MRFLTLLTAAAILAGTAQGQDPTMCYVIADAPPSYPCNPGPGYPCPAMVIGGYYGEAVYCWGTRMKPDANGPSKGQVPFNTSQIGGFGYLYPVACYKYGACGMQVNQTTNAIYCGVSATGWTTINTVFGNIIGACDCTEEAADHEPPTAEDYPYPTDDPDYEVESHYDDAYYGQSILSQGGDQ